MYMPHGRVAHPVAERLETCSSLRLLCAPVQDAIKVDARNPLARFERAAVLEDQGRLQEALHELTALKVPHPTCHLPAIVLEPTCCTCLDGHVCTVGRVQATVSWMSMLLWLSVAICSC